jgi:acetyltransferase-like isoleucine patch superfamily enzyme
MEDKSIAESATVEQNVTIGFETKVWHFAHIRSGATIGNNCTIGSNVFLDIDVSIGNACKIQNNSQIFSPAKIHDGVFVGPGVILTNDRYPRSINEDSSVKKNSDWEKIGVEVMHGASIGAGAICIAPIKIGTWAFIAAGSVVSSDVPDYAFMMGIPARQYGWVGKTGKKLKELGENLFTCEFTGDVFKISNGIMEPLNETN